MTEIATIDWFERWGTSVFSENIAIFSDDFGNMSILILPANPMISFSFSKSTKGCHGSCGYSTQLQFGKLQVWASHGSVIGKISLSNHQPLANGYLIKSLDSRMVKVRERIRLGPAFQITPHCPSGHKATEAITLYKGACTATQPGYLAQSGASLMESRGRWFKPRSSHTLSWIFIMK